jgi:hypothetical protein
MLVERRGLLGRAGMVGIGLEEVWGSWRVVNLGRVHAGDVVGVERCGLVKERRVELIALAAGRKKREVAVAQVRRQETGL